MRGAARSASTRIASRRSRTRRPIAPVPDRGGRVASEPLRRPRRSRLRHAMRARDAIRTGDRARSEQPFARPPGAPPVRRSRASDRRATAARGGAPSQAALRGDALALEDAQLVRERWADRDGDDLSPDERPGRGIAELAIRKKELAPVDVADDAAARRPDDSHVLHRPSLLARAGFNDLGDTVAIVSVEPRAAADRRSKGFPTLWTAQRRTR
jgi:hypothetical protein